METPCARKFITAKLSIRKPGSSSVSSINKVSLISEVIELSSINKVYSMLDCQMKIRAYGSKALQ
jgi:hypothetical protein